MKYKVCKGDESEATFEFCGPKATQYEMMIYYFAGKMTSCYKYGTWDIRKAENGAVWLSLSRDSYPAGRDKVNVRWAMNHFEGEMSWDALSLAASMFSLSFCELWEQYHVLNEVIADHPECDVIWRLMD